MKQFVLDDAEDHVSDAALTNGTRLVPSGAVFIVVRGMILAHTFPVCVADRPMAFNQDVKAIVPYSTNHGRFVAYWLDGRSNDLLRLVTEATHGTKRLEQRELQSLAVHLPPLPEQKQIAAILATLDDAIRTTGQIIAKLEQVKQGLLYDLLARGIDDNGELRDPERHPEQFKDSELGKVPRTWDVTKLGDVVPRATYGISDSLGSRPGIPVLRMMNFKAGEAELSDLKFSRSRAAEKMLLKPGDVLFNRTNSIDHVGRTGIWRGQIDRASFASYLVRLDPDPKRLRAEFLTRWLNWDLTQVRIRRFATPGVHQVNINPTNLRRTKIALPRSLEEQDHVVGSMLALDAQSRREAEQLGKLRVLKAGLMEDLLTGRVRVTTLVLPP